MPGVDLNLSLPSLSDPFSTILSKTLVALAAIEDDLAGKIVSSEIDINASLSMAGNALTSIGSLLLLGGNAPTAAGSVYYSNGEFYMIDATGVIQITSNGSLNTAAVGTIVGDYGGVNPARVSYNDASGEYRFTEDTGIWADLVADDLVLNGTAGSVRFGVDASVTTARQFLVKDIPTSGVSCLVYDASTSTLESAENKRITNDTKATKIEVSGDYAHTAEFSRRMGFHDFAVDALTTPPIVRAGTLTWQASSSSDNIQAYLPLRKGDRLKSIKFRLEKYAGNSTEIRAHLLSSTDILVSTLATGSVSSVGTNDFTLTVGSPVALGVEQVVNLVFTGANVQDRLSLLTITWDHP